MKRVGHLGITAALSILLTACVDGTDPIQPDVTPRASVGATSASTGPFAYVQTGGYWVSVIDAATHTLIDEVPTGALGSRGVIVAPDGATVYTLNEYSETDPRGPPGSVTVIDVRTNTLVDEVLVGTFPRAMAITPDGAFLYVANTIGCPNNRPSVSVVATATNTVAATVCGIGFNAFALQVSPDGAFVYVPAESWLSVIDVTTNTVTAQVPMTGGDVVFTPDGAFAYVIDRRDGVVWVIESATHTVVATVPVDERAGRMAVTPDGSFVYVMHGITASPSKVSVIETATNTVVTTVPIGANPQRVVMSPDGDFAYTPNTADNTVSVISTASHSVVATVPVSFQPIRLAVSPDGSLVYVSSASFQPNRVSVIETAGHTVLTSIVVDGVPGELAFAPALTPEQLVQNLIDDVQVLVDAGVLEPGAKGPLAIVEQAANAVASDRPSAIEQLEAFITAAQAEITSGTLTADQEAEVQALIDAAQYIIDLLSS